MKNQITNLNSQTDISIGNLNLGCFEISDTLFSELSQTAGRLLASKESVAKRDLSHKLAGQIYSGSQIKIIYDLSSAAKSELIELANTYRSSQKFLRDTSDSTLQLADCWLVDQRSGDYNPPHFHTTFLAGVCYLEIPDTLKSKPNVVESFDPSLELGGAIQFIPGFSSSAGPIAKPIVTLFPKPRQAFVFPGSLIHCVMPFRSEGRRLSVSFNFS